MREATLLLAGAVAFVLLIACTNLAHLLMARYVQIRKDIAIRVALGASRTHVIEQFLAESLILCLLGGSCGWLVAAGLIRGLLSMMPPAMFLQNVDVALDGRVLVFTAVLALATGVAFGLLPVWTFARGDLRSAGLNIAAPRGGATSGPFARHALLAAELALTLTLVSGSVLMLRSLTQLFAVDSGFQVAQTLAVRVKLDQTYFTTRPAVLNYQETMLTGIRALPGVASAAVSNVLPLIGRNSSTGVTLAGLPTSRVGAGQRFVSEDYFAAMGISVVRGRGLFESDMAGSAKTAVINETLARTLAKHRDPLNARILFHGQPVTIVGIVGDVKYWGPTSQQLNEIYVPLAQAPEKIALPELAFIIRATGEPAMLVRALRIMSTPLDRDVAVVGVRTMGEYLNDTVARPRFLGTLFGLFGVLSLGLTAVGIYGVISHLVSQRTREFGIRLALGAQRRDLLRLVMLEGLVVTLIGVSLGLFGALLLGRALSTLLFQVSASDPLLYAAAAILLTAVALLACWIPARRATAADPLVVLRAER
jgi:putative ABC transport system permease protein